MDYTIRKIKIEENIEVVDELVAALHVSEKKMNIHTADWSDIRQQYLQHMQECEDENDGVFLVAEKANEAIGFIFGYIDYLDNSNFESGSGHDLYISEGFVKPDFRREGIYTALNKALENQYQDIDIRRIYRYTLCNNEKMQQWLTSQGYKPVRLVYEKWIKK